MRVGLIGLMLAMASTAAQAQQVRRASPGVAAPAAGVDALAWIAGSWAAPGIDGQPASETYSPMLGGRITGHFVQQDADGGIAFSELVDFVPMGNSIAYRVRHFDPDFSGWEDRTGKPIVFPLVAVEGERWYFDGMTIDRIGPDAMTMWVRIGDEDAAREIPFRFIRTP